MNQKLISGLTVTLLLTAFGITLPGNANPSEAVDPGSEANLQAASSQPTPTVSLSTEVVKVGEQQSQSTHDVGEVIAKVHAHDLAGRQAATLYVRNIPVLTFVNSAQSTPEGVKIGTRSPESSRTGAVTAVGKSLVTSESSVTTTLETSQNSPDVSTEAIASEADPVWRATTIAAKLNQLNRDGVDAKQITVSFNATPDAEGTGSERYAIRVDNNILAVVDRETILPDTTNNLETDALQATNRLRRLLGDADPITDVTGKPRRRSQEISFGSIRDRINGWASWYGPGFHGNQSASGEVFNQNALTAAHRSLPFGTRVMVTNLHNGQSVVVRINDRGPYSGNRIIDLSAAAARVLGLIQTGVAPVRLDVIQNRTATAGN